MKLLIAEDDLTSRTMLVAVTANWGYEPVAVADGEAAWQVMQGDDPPRPIATARQYSPPPIRRSTRPSRAGVTVRF